MQLTDLISPASNDAQPTAMSLKYTTCIFNLKVTADTHCRGVWSANYDFGSVFSVRFFTV